MQIIVIICWVIIQLPKRRKYKTVLDGIISKLSLSRVEYVRGCAIRDTTNNEIAKAVEAANRADVVIAVVGGSSARDFKTTYKETELLLQIKAKSVIWSVEKALIVQLFLC